MIYNIYEQAIESGIVKEDIKSSSQTAWFMVGAKKKFASEVERIVDQQVEKFLSKLTDKERLLPTAILKKTNPERLDEIHRDAINISQETKNMIEKLRNQYKLRFVGITGLAAISAIGMALLARKIAKKKKEAKEIISKNKNVNEDLSMNITTEYLQFLEEEGIFQKAGKQIGKVSRIPFQKTRERLNKGLKSGKISSSTHTAQTIDNQQGWKGKLARAGQEHGEKIAKGAVVAGATAATLYGANKLRQRYLAKKKAEAQSSKEGKVKQETKNVSEDRQMDVTTNYLQFLSEAGDKKWIQKAISKPGSLHKQLGVPQDKKIPTSKLAVKPGDSSKLKKRKILAQTLKGISKKRKLGESLTESEEKILKIILEFTMPNPAEAVRHAKRIASIIEYTRKLRSECDKKIPEKTKRNKCYLAAAIKSNQMCKSVIVQECPKTKNPQSCKDRMNKEISANTQYIQQLKNS